MRQVYTKLDFSLSLDLYLCSSASLYLSIYLSLSLSVSLCPSVSLFLSLPVCLTICAWLFVCLCRLAGRLRAYMLHARVCTVFAEP